MSHSSHAHVPSSTSGVEEDVLDFKGIYGFGIGLAFPMLSVLTLKLSPPAEQGRNASSLQLSDALCSSVALAAAGLVFAHGEGSRAGFAGVMLIALALPAMGALLARRASVY